MRPDFDSLDQQRLDAMLALWNAQAGPRVGDFVRIGGELRRFTYDWGDRIQTTVGGAHPCAGDQSFFFAGEYVSFSGSLDAALDKGHLVLTGESMPGRMWFFHHGDVKAHNGVGFEVFCRVYEYRDPEAFARELQALWARCGVPVDEQRAALRRIQLAADRAGVPLRLMAVPDDVQ